MLIFPAWAGQVHHTPTTKGLTGDPGTLVCRFCIAVADTPKFRCQVACSILDTQEGLSTEGLADGDSQRTTMRPHGCKTVQRGFSPSPKPRSRER